MEEKFLVGGGIGDRRCVYIHRFRVVTGPVDKVEPAGFFRFHANS
jgi:hypothetical protein